MHDAPLAGNDEATLLARMVFLVFQVAIIIFAVRLGGGIMRRFKMPSVLGELLAGIVIGPYLLGGIKLPELGFPSGLFPLHPGSLPVSPELYGLATIASLILLFVSGLETDLRQFLKYSVAGTVVGLGGVVVSFVMGDVTGMLWGGTGRLAFFNPVCLFLGILCTATSIGITARILSEKKQMDSPEGVTILAAAIVDDVLGIVGLAIVLSIIDVIGARDMAMPWGKIGLIGLQSISVCVAFTALGLFIAPSLSRFLKSFRNTTLFAALALGMAFPSAGIFERSGLAMIIGAYVMGLSLSKTDITFVVQEKLHGLYDFFVPLFFAVMGMLVDLEQLRNPRVIMFGLLYTVMALLAKVIGCALPSLILNFNLKGALRIGVGMIPRGEVALIISSIGVTSGLLTPDIFGGAIIMTLLTTMLSPPLISAMLSIPGKGIRQESKADDYCRTMFSFPSVAIADAATDNVLGTLREEGFFESMVDSEAKLHQIRKDDLAFSMWREESSLLFSSNRRDVSLIGTLVYEAIVDLHLGFERLKELSRPDEFKRVISSTSSVRLMPFRRRADILVPECVIMDMTAETREDAVRQLVELLALSHPINDKESIITTVLEREKAFSTGIETGVALPHARIDAVNTVMSAVGICKKGVDFGCEDGSLSRLVILIVSPKNTSGPHLQFLTSISSALRTEDSVERVLNAKTQGEVARLLLGPKGMSIISRVPSSK